MFNFLKSKSTSNIDEQIYKDAYSAEQLLLNEARLILTKTPTFNKEKAERLKQLEQLGFSNIEEAVKLKEEQKELKYHSEINAMINYCRRVYPFNKFISQESVQVLLKKHNLLLAKASDYIAEIPEKNQKEIIAFRVMKKDIRVPKEINSFGGWGGLMLPTMFDFMGFNHQPQQDYQIIKNHCEIMGITMEEWYKQEGERKRIAKIEAKKKKKVAEREKVCGKDLLIIAPQHKLDMRGKTVVKGILKLKDPIVLQPVPMGYLIVSSWGLEASDPLVVNTIEN